jgi:hypothetical protein
VPKVRRHDLPSALFHSLLERIQSRRIPATQLGLLATWLDREPDVPEGEWYMRFSGMTVCGEGELIKTFLLAGQAPKASAFLLDLISGQAYTAVTPSKGGFRRLTGRMKANPQHDLLVSRRFASKSCGATVQHHVSSPLRSMARTASR